jgi:FMN-dependent dehydrogenase
MFDGVDLSKVTATYPTSLNWEFVNRLRDIVTCKLLLKGIVTSEESQIAIEHGVDGLIVSNRGGRDALLGMFFGQREDAGKLIPSDLAHPDTLPSVTNHSERAQKLFPGSDPAAGWAAFRDIVFRSPTFPLLGRRTEEYGLSDRQSTGASDRAVNSRVVLVRTNDRLHHFWRRTC